MKKIFSVAMAVLIVFSIFTGTYATTNINPTNINNTTIYVSLDGDDNNDGLTEATSKRTIQNAVWSVKEGGTVHVKHGIYQENIDIGKNVKLIGENKENTIVDGRQIDHCIKIHSVVTIEKITIQNGGPGIYIESGGHDLVIKDSTITKNSGPGIYAVFGSKLKVQNTTITKNTAYIGGGIRIRDGYLEVIDSIISDNKAERSGGGISSAGSHIIVNNSNISSNTGDYGGGVCGYGPIDINGSFIVDNEASSDGGGIWSVDNLNIVETFIMGNKAHSGGGIYKNDRIGRLNDSVVRDNSAVYGAGIYAVNTVLILDRLDILSNNARTGGGIYNDHGATISLKNSNIQNNWAWYKGGGIYNQDLIYIDNLTKINKNKLYNLSGEPLRSLETGEIINT